MGRVVATFAAFALAYPLFAMVMHGVFGTAGALTLAGVTIAATVVLGVPASCCCAGAAGLAGGILPVAAR